MASSSSSGNLSQATQQPRMESQQQESSTSTNQVRPTKQPKPKKQPPREKPPREQPLANSSQSQNNGNGGQGQGHHRPPPGFKQLPQRPTEQSKLPPRFQNHIQRQQQSKPRKEDRSQINGTSSSDDSDVCIVCYLPPKSYSIGLCNHPVCTECSIRMRVLLGNKECPICRAEMGEVLFTSSTQPVFALSPHQIFLPSYGIYIESEELKTQFDSLLSNKCKYCPEVYGSWEDLTRHIAKAHSLYACQLCTENIKLFPSEHSFYTRQDLALHTRTGKISEETKSASKLPQQKPNNDGHPLCQFCSNRYFDNDELFKHLRRDHYYCHFCDADGYNFYYNTYEELRVHFRIEHWLCEEGACKDELFTCVWREEVDWRAHTATVHSKLLGKHGVKAARTIDVNFNLPTREDKRSKGRNPSRQIESEPVFVSPVPVKEVQVDTGDVAQFPTLNPAAPTATGTADVSTNANQLRSAATWARANTRGLRDEFPALVSSSSETNQASIATGWGSHQGPQKQHQQPQSSKQGGNQVDDFPSLAASSTPKPAPSSSWSSRAKPKQQNKTSKEPAPPPQLDFIPLPDRYKKKSARKKPPPLDPLPTREELHLKLLESGAVPLVSKKRED